jgi:hypothetical protein
LPTLIDIDKANSSTGMVKNDEMRADIKFNHPTLILLPNILENRYFVKSEKPQKFMEMKRIPLARKWEDP